jgi:hypothetical protein
MNPTGLKKSKTTKHESFKAPKTKTAKESMIPPPNLEEYIVLEMPALKGLFDKSEKALYARNIGSVDEDGPLKENPKDGDQSKPVERMPWKSNSYYHTSEGPSPFLFLGKKEKKEEEEKNNGASSDEEEEQPAQKKALESKNGKKKKGGKKEPDNDGDDGCDGDGDGVPDESLQSAEKNSQPQQSDK